MTWRSLHELYTDLLDAHRGQLDRDEALVNQMAERESAQQADPQLRDLHVHMRHRFASGNTARALASSSGT